MKCDYCGSEMSLNGNMYVCNECFTTYIVKNDIVIKRYIVSVDFANEYKKSNHILASNDSEQKLKAIQRLLHIYSNCPSLWNLLGVLYSERNQIKDAVWCYEQALKLNPDYTQIIVNTAISYAKLNDLEKANQKMEIAYAKMEKTHPNYGIMLGNYAMIVGRMGDKEKASKLINEAEARGYKYGAIVRKEVGIGSESKKSSGKGFFGRLKEHTQQAREDAAVKSAYQAEVEKRKSHVKRVRHKRALTPQEQQTIDMIKMERDAKILEWRREGADLLDATFARTVPYNNRINEIKNRAVWYEDVVIPPEIDPSVPIVIDEEAIRRSVRK